MICSILFASLLLAADFEWKTRPGFPVPVSPAGNPASAPKAELGRYLFYDKRLSANGTQSCGTCHIQQLAFTDGLARARGSTGSMHPRSSMSLANIGFVSSLTWANPRLEQLEEQALVPMLGSDPIVELGLREASFLKAIRRDATYQRLFPAAFPGAAQPFTLSNVTKAIATFERTLISTNAPYDRYRYDGEANALSASAKRGEILFFSSEKAGCFQCHGGWYFGSRGADFRNTGLYLDYPAANRGLGVHTGKAEDSGKFRVPTLRNIAVTAPYMHDGSVATLEAAIDHYANGGRAPANPAKDRIVRPFPLTSAQKADLVEFLKSLTDDEFLRDPRFSDPWPRSVPNGHASNRVR